jgi:hypothetical protein
VWADDFKLERVPSTTPVTGGGGPANNAFCFITDLKSPLQACTDHFGAVRPIPSQRKCEPHTPVGMPPGLGCSSWPEYRITWRFEDSRYEIAVSNPMRRCRGVAQATLDGAPVDASAIPLVNDGRTHDVQIVLGDQPSRQLDVQRLTMASGRG